MVRFDHAGRAIPISAPRRPAWLDTAWGDIVLQGADGREYRIHDPDAVAKATQGARTEFSVAPLDQKEKP